MEKSNLKKSDTKEEVQESLVSYDEKLKFENFKPLAKLKSNPKSLEEEKRKFIDFSLSFIGNIDLEGKQYKGRPRIHLKDIIKSLLVMAYHGFSYRRAESDLNKLYEEEFINRVPPRSVLNRHMTSEVTKKIIERLIEISALIFIEHEDTLIIDSTWLAPRMYTGGYRKVYDKKSAPLERVRKLHIACLKNSRIIACAKASKGTANDSPFFKDLVLKVVKNGFNIKMLLADAGYTGKENYAFCQTLNIRDVYIDFRKNATLRRAKSETWRKKLREFRENPEQWHENYRFRVIIEGVFSAIKRKQVNYLRSRLETAQDVELLLKCLVYNLTIIGRYS